MILGFGVFFIVKENILVNKKSLHFRANQDGISVIYTK